MSKKNEFIQNLTQEQQENLLEHFNSIYECRELSEHEFNMAYLAWIWAKGLIYKDISGISLFNEEEAGVQLTDYEITIENEVGAGINLDLTYDYYDLDRLIKKMRWDEQFFLL